MMPLPYSATSDDIMAVAKTVAGEARGEACAGQIAVAWVIRNRATMAANRLRRNLFGDGTLRAACFVKSQFTCWNEGNPNGAILRHISMESMLNDVALRRCLLAALEVIEGKQSDPTCGSTHYFANYIRAPNWANTLRPIATIGRHMFFNNVP